MQRREKRRSGPIEYVSCACLQSSLDHLVAAELWWRTAALQALLAYVQGVVLQAAKADQARLCKRVAAFLKPLLDVISAHAALQVGQPGDW